MGNLLRFALAVVFASAGYEDGRGRAIGEIVSIVGAIAGVADLIQNGEAQQLNAFFKGERCLNPKKDNAGSDPSAVTTECEEDC